MFILKLLLKTLVLLVFGVSSLFGHDLRAESEVSEFQFYIEDGDLSDLRLTIYYLNPSVKSQMPISLYDLMVECEENPQYSAFCHKIIVQGSELEEHIGLLRQIDADKVRPVRVSTPLEARIYYVFETTDGARLLDVAMWGECGTIYVNGYEIKENKVFYDVIKPFLTEEEKTELEQYVSR